MPGKNYYTILDVSENASSDEIKTSYRKLARKYHPDVSKLKGAEDKFKDISEAYDVLKDGTKRREYDQMQKGGFSGFNSGQGAESQQRANPGEFGDIFESFFGGRSRVQSQGGRKGENIETELKVDLETVFTGGERVVQLKGTGSTSRKLKVKIPQGILDGKQIRLSGQGHEGSFQGQRGDLLLTITYLNHPRFIAQLKDIYLKFPIAPWEAALGTKVSIPTLAGDVTMNIPAGSNSGTKLRLAKRGLPGSPDGDQYVELIIKNPPLDDKKQHEIYEKLRDTFDFDPRESW